MVHIVEDHVFISHHLLKDLFSALRVLGEAALHSFSGDGEFLHKVLITAHVPRPEFIPRPRRLGGLEDLVLQNAVDIASGFVVFGAYLPEHIVGVEPVLGRARQQHVAEGLHGAVGLFRLVPGPGGALGFQRRLLFGKVTAHIAADRHDLFIGVALGLVALEYRALPRYHDSALGAGVAGVHVVLNVVGRESILALNGLRGSFGSRRRNGGAHQTENRRGAKSSQFFFYYHRGFLFSVKITAYGNQCRMFSGAFILHYLS